MATGIDHEDDQPATQGQHRYGEPRHLRASVATHSSLGAEAFDVAPVEEDSVVPDVGRGLRRELAFASSC
jgi:hypothetical protein